VEDRQERPPQQQTRARVAHHGTHLLAAGGLVTVDRTGGARGFVPAVAAVLEAVVRIGGERGARRAQAAALTMMVATIERDHCVDGLAFAIQSPLSSGYHARLHGKKYTMRCGLGSA